MKNLLPALALALLLGAPSATAATIHEPGVVLDGALSVLVVVDEAPATITLTVADRNATASVTESGPATLRVPNLDDGWHLYRVHVQAPNASSSHDGAVLVYNLPALVRVEINPAIQAARAAQGEAQAAEEAAYQAAQAVPSDVVRRGGLEALAHRDDVADVLRSDSFTEWTAAHDDAQAAHDDELGADLAGIDAAMQDIEGNAGFLVLVLALATGLVTLYLSQQRRQRQDAATTDALVRAIALRLDLGPDSPEYQQVLAEPEERPRRSLLDFIRPRTQPAATAPAPSLVQESLDVDTEGSA